MDTTKIIENAKVFIKEYFQNDTSGHDHWHILRVYDTAVKIAKNHKCDMFVVELASLLHDVDDEKINKTDNSFSEEFLRKENVSENIIDEVMYIIKNQSYRNSLGKGALKTIEARIVQDADRLDAIGAIAIARVFTYGGKTGRSMYDPNEQILEYKNIDEYRNSSQCSVNHIYEKLVKLKALLNTKTAKKIAISRHNFMLKYLKQFENEWQGIR